ncbi:hypothetical protein [Streptomyces sp. KS 21]|uniref:hypothetical protein n=1 Tax=Streptomyces sp. KS 21 TaxID=2485150 RepID=UPI00106327E2|nr:hypothetical protein [Streptomyces sp. KS 21]TDU74452.1 hypothetical protein EDD91_1095 [Streptomyces sp. KS 21]
MRRPPGPRPASRPRPTPLTRRLRSPLAALALLAPALLGALGPDGSGETIPLSGSEPGQHLDVTLTRVVDPADPGPAPAGSGSGSGSDRLVAVQFRLENTGTAVYQDSPAKSSHLLDSEGQRFTGSNTTTAAGPAFPETVSLAPGGSAFGFVTFRLPNHAALAAVQFALNSGLADDVGHWSLS